MLFEGERKGKRVGCRVRGGGGRKALGTVETTSSCCGVDELPDERAIAPSLTRDIQQPLKINLGPQHTLEGKTAPVLHRNFASGQAGQQ